MQKSVIHLIILFFLLSFFSCKRDREVVKETFPDGSKKVVLYYKKNSEYVFKEIHYYQDGKRMMEGTLDKGLRNGRWYFWYPNGQLWTEGGYEKDIEQGYKVVFHENGKKYYEGTYKDGNRSGIWRFYNNDGKEVKTIDYDLTQNKTSE